MKSKNLRTKIVHKKTGKVMSSELKHYIGLTQNVRQYVNFQN